MPSEDIKILEFNQYQKSEKATFIIYADLECLIEKIDGVKIILKIHSQQKQANIFHEMTTISSFKTIENKYDVQRGKDYIKKFYESFKEHTIKIIN